MDKKKIFLNTLKWGFILWLIGYVLGIALFFFMPAAYIGWAILPIGMAVTFRVLLKYIERPEFKCYVMLGVFWTIIAVVLDYLFIVKMLKPVDGYYKLDVYFYYALTLLLPPLVGWWKMKKETTINF